MTSLRTLRASALAAAVAASTLTMTAPAHAATWDWSYTATGIAASGTFTTTDTPDANGFFEITAITGSRNGVAIVGLQPTGTAIPGNEPYAVDNLVSISGPQLTWDGFGYAMADGSYANPFSDGTTAWEYLSVPPYVDGAGQEVAVAFSATPVPEPGTGALALIGLVGLVATSRARRGC